MTVMKKYEFLPTLFPSIMTKAIMHVIKGGFVINKVLGTDYSAANAFLAASKQNYLVCRNVFQPSAITSTERMDLFLYKNESYTFSAAGTLRTCQQFANQNCESKLQTLLGYETTSLIDYFFYANDTLVLNYTKYIDSIVDSCFDSGVATLIN